MTTATPDLNDPAFDSGDNAETCPKCHTTTPWRESSWCPDCGYYPGITDAVPQEAKPAEEEYAELVEETTTDKKQPLLPGWVTATISGATTVFVAAFAANYYFIYYGGDRSLVSFCVLLTGLASFLSAHLITSIASMKESGDIAPFDIIGSPIEMWRPTIHGLPKTGKRIFFGVCGAAAIFSSLFIIGGLDFNSIFEKEEVETKKPGIFKRIVGGTAEAAAEQEEPESVEEAFEEMMPVVEELDPASSALLPSPDEPLKCVVYGYMKDGKDDFGRILLAAEIHNIRVHVASIEAKRLPIHIRENLAEQLPKIGADQPGVKSRYHGNWVKPKIAFDISFEGWSMNGELIKPRISMSTAKSTDP